jgi:hypothetical protein
VRAAGCSTSHCCKLDGLVWGADSHLLFTCRLLPLPALHSAARGLTRMRGGAADRTSTSRGARSLAALPSSGARSQPEGLAGLAVPTGTEGFRQLDKRALPAAHTLTLAHSLGTFFIMGQNVTEVFSVFDPGADMAEAVRLTRHAQAMRAASLRSVGVQPVTFELARSKLLKVQPVLEVLLSNVYSEPEDAMRK